MDPRLETNRTNWDSRVQIHAQSRFYDVDSWLRDAPGPPNREVEALGDLTGRTLVHLQCHFGMDTLSWARAGAIVTGVDFSPAAIDEARSLAQRAGLSDRSTFVCANVLDAPRALSGARFDVAYVSLGSLCWLPDVDAWGGVVADLLEPWGRLYIHDVHPLSECLDRDGERVTYGYFEEPNEPLIFDDSSTYTDGGKLGESTTYEWNHSIGEIVASLMSRGFVLDALMEHDWTVFQQFPWLIDTTSGVFSIPEGRVRIPLSFTILARAPRVTKESTQPDPSNGKPQGALVRHPAISL
jgi:SAM-dependent methyltransferase